MDTTIIIVGAGPAGLIAADHLSASGHAVALYDAMPSPARKLLMAGRGGLNLTHSEPLERFLGRYGAARGRMEPLIRAFTPDDLRDWCHGLGIETFIGSSGRVFPRGMKASPLVRALLRRLEARGVRLFTRHRFAGWDGGALVFTTPDGEARVTAPHALFALGGASWPRLGSSGDWLPVFAGRGVPVVPFAPANCGVDVGWSPPMARFGGAVLKAVMIAYGGERLRGDVVMTATGLEGGPVYPLSLLLREPLAHGPQMISIDLRPDQGMAALAGKLASGRAKDSVSTRLTRTLKLPPQAVALMREGGPLPHEPEALAARVKGVAIRVEALRPIERAISSAGGIQWAGIDDNLMLTALPGIYVAGEMLDWAAPTGGYLLQGCMATGLAAARAIDAAIKRGA